MYICLFNKTCYGPRFVVEICILIIFKKSCLIEGFIGSWEAEMVGANTVGICLKPTDASIEDGAVR